LHHPVEAAMVVDVAVQSAEQWLVDGTSGAYLSGKVWSLAERSF